MPPPRIPRFSTSPLLSHLRNLRTRPSTSTFSRFPCLRNHIFTASRNKPRKEPTLGMSILRFGQFFLAFHVFWKYFYSVSTVQGISMVPTIPHHHGRKFPPVILISKYYRRGRGVKVGDVIIYTHPMMATSQGCKRVIGMPGDWVSVVTPGKRDADIELGVEEEARRQENGEWASVREEMVQVPPGHCWIAGDNLEWSRDSRLFGPVPLALVKGKVLAVCWPWSTVKWLGGRRDSGRLADASDRMEEREWVIAK